MAGKSAGRQGEAAPEARRLEGVTEAPGGEGRAGWAPVWHWASPTRAPDTAQGTTPPSGPVQELPEEFSKTQGAWAAQGEVLLLLPQDVHMDVVENVEVDTQEPPEQEEEEDPEVVPREYQLAPAGRGSPESLSPMQELRALQWELGSTRARGSRAYARLKRKMGRRCGAYLARRRAILLGVPGFWTKAIVQHPQLSSIINAQDQDLLGYVSSFEVELGGALKTRCCLSFSFGPNPYFRNEVIRKEYRIGISGYKEMGSTAVQWYWDCEGEAPSSVEASTHLTFFNWLSSRRCPGSNRIAEILLEDLWLNPVPYYLGLQNPEREELEECPGACR